MSTQTIGLHHLHKRKRIFKKLERYPPPNKFVRFVDDFIYIVAIIIPLMTIPQVLKIWISRSAENVSLITWSAFLLSAVSWLFYSIIHKDKPLIINSVLWIILELFVIIGILIY